MKAVPNTMGQLRRMLAEACHEVRYGHMDPQRGVATAKIAAQIANLIKVEIEAAQFMAEVGGQQKSLGELPINKFKTLNMLEEEAS